MKRVSALAARIPQRWRWVLTAFVISKVVLTVLGFAIVAAFDEITSEHADPGQVRAAGHPVSSMRDWNPVVMWFRYDAFHYQWLTELSYAAPLSDGEKAILGPGGRGPVEPPVSRFAFAPLLPLLAKAVLPLVGDVRIAILVVTNAALLLLLWATAGLAEELFDAETARLAVMLTATAPTAFLLQAGLTESLFTGLSVLAVWMALRRDWGWAALAGFLAGLTRSSGFLIAVPLGILVLTQVPWRGPARAVVRVLVPGGLASAAPAVAWAGFLTYCKVMTGDFLVYSRLQKIGWGVQTRAPWSRLVDVFRSDDADATTLKAALVVLLVVALLVSVRFVPWPLALYCLLLLALPMASLELWDFSIIRYASGLFALTLMLAAWCRRRPWLTAPVVAVSAVFQGFFFTLWTLEWTGMII